MSRRPYPPAQFRYFKARLWNLARPGFWVSAIFLSVVGLAIKEYWTNPNFLTTGEKNQVASQNKLGDSSLSPEDKAIAADIDNLPVLINDFDQNIPSSASTAKENTQLNNSKNLLEDLIKKQQAANEKKSNPASEQISAPVAQAENPFVTQANNLLQFSNFGNNSKSLGVNSLTPSPTQQGTPGISGLGTQLTNQTNSTPNVPAASALQKALDQSATQNQQSLNNTTQQTNPFGKSPTTNGLSNQPFSPNNNLNRSNTTGYTEPTVTNLQQNPFNNFSRQTIGGNTGTTVTNQLPNSYNNNFSRQTGTGYSQPTVTNLAPNPTGYTGTTVTNQPPNPTGYTGTTVTNQPPNSYNNNFSGTQTSPNVQTQGQVVSPATTVTPNNIAPNIQTPSQSVITPTNPVVTDNNGNSVFQQPYRVPQNYNNSSYPSQVPGQYTGGNRINGYPYP